MTDVAIIHGVLVGCDPSISADGTLAIADGSILNQNITAPVSAQNWTATSGDATYDRYDTVYATSSGSVSALTGNTDGSLYQPDSSDVVIAKYIMRAGATTIAPGDLQDVRTFALLPQPAQTFAMTFLSSAWVSGDPGAARCQFDTTNINTIAHLIVSYTSASAPQSFKTWLQLGASPSAPWGVPWYLKLWSRKDPSKWLVVEVTAFSDQTTYCNLTCTVVGSSAGTNSPPISTDALDTILEFAGIVPPTVSYPTATNGSVALTADVSLTAANTFFDGPNTGVIGGAGQTLFFSAQASVLSGVTNDRITVRLTDGSTVFAEAEIGTPTTADYTIPLTAIVSPSATATYKIQAATTGGTAGTLKKAATSNSSGNLATKISWMQLA